MAMTDASGWWAAAPVVDVQADKRVWWRRIKRWCSVVSALVRVWWPVTAPAAVALVFMARFGLPAVVAFLAVVVVVAGELVAWPRAGVALVTGPRRSVEALFRTRWARTCSRAGVAVAADGAFRFPRLVSVTLTCVPFDWSRPWRWRPWHPVAAMVVCDPLPSQDVASWQMISDRLARQLGFSMVTPVVIDTTRLELRLRRESLPAVVRLGEDVPVEAVAPDPHVVALGESSLGGVIRWLLDVPSRTSLFIAGAMGGGKGNVMRLVLLWCRAQLLAGRQVQAIILNPKGSGEFSWCEGWASVCDSARAQCRAVEYVHMEMTRRAIILRRYGLDTWLDLPDEALAEFGGRLVLMIDEFVSFAQQRVPVAKNEPDPIRVAMLDLLAIAQMGRALGVNLLVATQHPIAELMGPSGVGSTLIANLAGRIGVGALEPSGAGSLFGKSHGEQVAARLRGKASGRGFYTALSDDEAGDGPVLGQFWFAKSEFVKGLPPVPGLRLVRDFEVDDTVVQADDEEGVAA